MKIRNIILSFIGLVLLFNLSGCATIQGVGRDVESVGRTLENAAN